MVEKHQDHLLPQANVRLSCVYTILLDLTVLYTVHKHEMPNSTLKELCKDCT